MTAVLVAEALAVLAALAVIAGYGLSPAWSEWVDRTLPQPGMSWSQAGGLS